MNYLLKIAIKAAVESGKSILKIYNSNELGINCKADKSPITKADLVSNKVIISYLKKTNIPILSEESKIISFKERKEWDQLWIIDPLDGTKEFIKRNGEFTVNIALVKEQKLEIGVVFLPVSGELYFSCNSIGAFKVVVDCENYDVTKLIDSGRKLPFFREDDTFTVVLSRSHTSVETENYVNELKKKYGKIKLIDAGSSLKLCIVAEGIADCYPRLAPTMEWDTAAGQAICENSGYEVIDWNTKSKLSYNKINLINNWFIVKKNNK